MLKRSTPLNKSYKSIFLFNFPTIKAKKDPKTIKTLHNQLFLFYPIQDHKNFLRMLKRKNNFQLLISEKAINCPKNKSSD